MSSDWDGRAEGLTRVEAFIVRATVHSTSWGRERRREAGAAGEAGTQTHALLALGRPTLIIVAITPFYG